MTYRDINPRDERMQCLAITPIAAGGQNLIR
jgi:hypothetical protein